MLAGMILSVVFIVGLALNSDVYGDELSPEIKALIGTKYVYPQSIEIISKYGNPQTLSGTNNRRWVAYFPKGDFTIISDKASGTIKRILSGNRPQ